MNGVPYIFDNQPSKAMSDKYDGHVSKTIENLFLVNLSDHIPRMLGDAILACRRAKIHNVSIVGKRINVCIDLGFLERCWEKRFWPWICSLLRPCGLPFPCEAVDKHDTKLRIGEQEVYLAVCFEDHLLESRAARSFIKFYDPVRVGTRRCHSFGFALFLGFPQGWRIWAGPNFSFLYFLL